jgi:hypothetical protein
MGSEPIAAASPGPDRPARPPDRRVPRFDQRDATDREAMKGIR